MGDGEGVEKEVNIFANIGGFFDADMYERRRHCERA